MMQDLDRSEHTGLCEAAIPSIIKSGESSVRADFPDSISIVDFPDSI